MNNATQSCQRIYKRLEELGRPTVSFLRPGLSESEISRRLAAENLTCPAGFVELYSWRDGTRVDTTAPLNDLFLYPWCYFVSLEEALATRRSLLDGDVWNKDYLPLFTDRGGGYSALDCSRKGRGGMRTGVSLEDQEHSSLETMLDFIAQAYETSVFWMDPQGGLERNVGAAAELGKKLNPGLNYWRTYGQGKSI
jgi:hypothetical protein